MSEELDAEGLEAVRYAAGVLDELVVAFMDEIRAMPPACCDLHGRNCEPEEPCCENCTEVHHAGWTDGRGVRRFGHPAGERCSAPIVSTRPTG